ncbi:hypothetical protein ACP4OV_031730 [Aristida adscensionis]
MADDEKCADGNDWELVSLTASTYAAAPGPVLPMPDTDKRDAAYFDPISDSPASLLLSGHFISPTKQDDRLHLLKEPDCKAGSDKVCDTEFTSAVMLDDTDLNSSDKLDHDLPGFSLFHKHNTVYLGDVVFGDGMGLGGLSLAGEEQTMFHTHHAAGPATEDIADLSRPAGAAPVGSVVSEDAHDATSHSKIPSEAWWKKTFSFICDNAKESVTFRFFFVAATIVGLAILGQHLQGDKLQCQKFRLRFNADSEKIGCAMGPLGQVKDAMIGGSQQQGVVCPGAEL